MVSWTSLNNLRDIELDPREEEGRVEPTKEVKSFQLGRETPQCIKLGCQMTQELIVQGFVRDEVR